MIDGVVARKTDSASKFGARLDTLADFVFMFICCVKILPILQIHTWVWAWIVIIALIKAFNITLVFTCKKKLISIHSALNKIAGFALFILPLSLSFFEAAYCVVPVCALATLAALQEAYFIASGREIL